VEQVSKDEPAGQTGGGEGVVLAAFGVHERQGIDVMRRPSIQ
jgi:hypothetical protein